MTHKQRISATGADMTHHLSHIVLNNTTSNKVSAVIVFWT